MCKELRPYPEEAFRELAEQKESRIEEEQLPDYVDMATVSPSQYAASRVVAAIKERSPIHLARV